MPAALEVVEDVMEDLVAESEVLVVAMEEDLSVEVDLVEDTEKEALVGAEDLAAVLVATKASGEVDMVVENLAAITAKSDVQHLQLAAPSRWSQ